MDYDALFTERLDALKREGRYRVFADLERIAGAFPRAVMRRDGAEREVPSAAERKSLIAEAITAKVALEGANTLVALAAGAGAG